jgi:hypothetical protein
VVICTVMDSQEPLSMFVSALELERVGPTI